MGDRVRVGSRIIINGKVRTVKRLHTWTRGSRTKQPIHRGASFEECDNCGLTIWAHYDYEEAEELE